MRPFPLLRRDSTFLSSIPSLGSSRSFRYFHFALRYCMHQSPSHDAVKDSYAFPAPPRPHWAVLLLLLTSAEALVFRLFPEPYRNFAVFVVAAAWPTYLCIWVRKIDHRASSLYWAIA